MKTGWNLISYFIKQSFPPCNYQVEEFSCDCGFACLEVGLVIQTFPINKYIYIYIPTCETSMVFVFFVLGYCEHGNNIAFEYSNNF